jgi:hypothetical protein
MAEQFSVCFKDDDRIAFPGEIGDKANERGGRRRGGHMLPLGDTEERKEKKECRADSSKVGHN